MLLTLFEGQQEKQMRIWICADCVWKNILMVQENSEFLINKHIWVLLLSVNLCIHVEAPIWQMNLDVSVNTGPLDQENRSVQRRVSRERERE